MNWKVPPACAAPAQENMSIGEYNLIRAISMYPARILEQVLMDYYKPDLNNFKPVSFFNFPLKTNDFFKNNVKDKLQVWEYYSNILIFSSDSIKDLAIKTGVARSTIRNYLNWHEGIDLVINGNKLKVLIREKGSELRYELTEAKKKLNDRYSTVVLSDINLTDLDKGMSYAANPLTKKIVLGPFSSRLDLYKALFPNKWRILEAKGLNSSQKSMIGERITRYMNWAVPGGIKTEMGSFWYCCNPESPFKYNRKPKPLYSVSTQGLCTWYPNNSSIPNMERHQIHNLRLTNKTFNGIQYIDESILLKLFPDIPRGINATYNLSLEQLLKLKNYLIESP